MVPKVAGKGKSFKGAAAYYLHDKQARSSERVAFTHTLNLPTQDAELAWRIMARTAATQNEIKAAAGSPATGRKLENSVYVYSLSWAPDEKPTQQEMLDAAQQTLTELGLTEHQVLLVSHNDEPHPHIHVIVNRVHPETGLAAKLSKDHLVLSRWAEAYEKRQGQIRCEQRPINNERRREAFVRHSNRARDKAYHHWRRQQASQATDRRRREQQALAARHRDRRLQSAREKIADIAEKRGLLAEKADAIWWSALYRQQRRETEKIRLQQMVARTRLREALKQNTRLLHADKASRSGHLRQAFQAVSKSEAALMKLKSEHKLERIALAERLREMERADIRDIEARHREKERPLRDAEAEERYRLDAAHSRESQEAAKRIRDGRERLRFDTGSAFRRAAGKLRLDGIFAGKAGDAGKLQSASDELNRKSGRTHRPSGKSGRTQETGGAPGAGSGPAERPARKDAPADRPAGDDPMSLSASFRIEGQPYAVPGHRQAKDEGDRTPETNQPQSGRGDHGDDASGDRSDGDRHERDPEVEAALRDIYRRTLEEQERRAREEAERRDKDDRDRGDDDPGREYGPKGGPKA